MTEGGGNGNIGFFFTMGTEKALKAGGGDRNGVVKPDKVLFGDTFLNSRVFGGGLWMPLSEYTFSIVAIDGIEEAGTSFCTDEC